MEDLKDTNARTRMEYATQWFGFPPESFIDTFIGDCTDIVSQELKVAKKQVLKEFQGKVEAKELNLDRLDEQLREVAEDVYYKFGLFLKDHILCVPEDVVLPEDKCHADDENSVKIDSSDVKASQENFDELCLTIKKAKLQREVLKTKLKNLELIRDRQASLVKRVKALKETEKVGEILDKDYSCNETKLRALDRIVATLENDENEPDNGKRRSIELDNLQLAKRLKK